MNAESDRIALLQRINTYLNSAPRWRCDVVESGPFDIFLNRGGGHPWMSYARPARVISGNLVDGIRAVASVFTERGYVPRWEYIDDLTPELTPALIAAGYATPEMRPLMLLSAPKPAVVPPGVEIRRVSDDAGMEAVSLVLWSGFGMTEDDPHRDPDDLRNLSEGGMRVYAAFVDAKPVAGGVQFPVNGVSELAGIATLPEYRCRGIGAALTATMADAARQDGCDLIFLSAGDEEIARVYRNAGFETIGHAGDTMSESD